MVGHGEGFRCKSRIEKLSVNVDGVEHALTQKVVAAWSRKYFERDRRKHQRKVELLESLSEPSDPESPEGVRLIPVSKTLRSYIKEGCAKELKARMKDGELEKVSADEVYHIIDRTRLERDVGLLGCCEIVTSELEMTDGEVLGAYKNLVTIEDHFREMKSTLRLRPAFVRTPGHVRAHLVICFLALVMLRLIQMRVREHEQTGPRDDGQHTWGISGARVVDALNAWAVARLPGGRFAMTSAAQGEQAREDLERILAAYGIRIPLDVFTRMDLYQLGRTWKITIGRIDMQ